MVTVLAVIYLIALMIGILVILPETKSAAKAMAYILVVIVFPVLGMLFYFAVGVNFRHKKIKNKGVASSDEFVEQFSLHLKNETEELKQSHKAIIGPSKGLIHFIHKFVMIDDR